jgi:cellulose synthase/poly-beta-1,6-N-acetylglucosamine synthase-like glycosyltransferase
VGVATKTIRLAAVFVGTHVLVVWLSAIRRGRAARTVRASEARPDSWPLVSVIVPAWAERGTLQACIRSLESVVYPDWEVIVVAGGPDGTYEHAVALTQGLPRARVLKQEPRGKNAALNQGLAVAEGDVIVLLDADCDVAPGWLEALAGPIRDATVATTGRIVPRRRTPISLGTQMEMISTLQVRGVVRLQGAASIGVHRTTIEEIGGFPEDVIVGIDWDLDVRLATRQVRRVFCPDATVRTEIPATLREYWKNEVRWRRAHLASLYRHKATYLGSPRAVVTNIYLYVLAWAVASGTVAALVLALSGDGPLRSTIGRCWLIAVAWLGLRRAALGAEVAAYCGDLSFVRVAWVPPVLLGITVAAIVPATVTVRRRDRHFKGPRPVLDHAD